MGHDCLTSTNLKLEHHHDLAQLNTFSFLLVRVLACYAGPPFKGDGWLVAHLLGFLSHITPTSAPPGDPVVHREDIKHADFCKRWDRYAKSLFKLFFRKTYPAIRDGDQEP